MSYTRIEPLLSDLFDLNRVGSSLETAHLSKYITLIFFLFFSILFILHMIVKLIIYVVKVEDTSAQDYLQALHSSNNKQLQGGRQSSQVINFLQQNVNLVFDNIASIYYQLILFVFFIPSAQIFSDIYNDQLSGYGFTLAALSFLNIIIHLIIVVIYVLHDYDYEISYSDHLSKRDSLWGLFHIFSNGIMAIFFNTSWGMGISIFHSVLKIVEMIELFVEFPYYDESIRKWNSLYLFSHFSFSGVAFLFMFLDLQHHCNISLIYLIVIPIAIQIGSFVFVRMELRVKQVYKHSKNPSHIDLYVRHLFNLYDMEYNKYTQLKYGVEFESIYTEHIRECHDFKCFCQEFQYLPFKWENFVQSDERSSFLQNFITKLLDSSTILIQNKKDHQSNRLRFTYLQFLIEKVSNPTKAFTQVIANLKDLNHFSIKEQYELHIIMRRCQTSYRSFFIESVYQNQRLPMMTVISFDTVLETSINLLRDILSEVRSFYNYICQDLIDIDQVNSSGQEIIQKRYFLEQNIRLLFDLNSRSDILFGLVEGYSSLIDLRSRRLSYHIRRGLDLLHRNTLKQDSFINLTDLNSCIIYTSFSNLGQIQKITHSFSSIFGVQQNRIIGKSLNQIMPDTISENHDKYISKFLEKGTMQNMNIQRTNLFGKNSQGFIFPISLRIRLNYIGYEDFGVCGYIKKIKDSYSEYIILDKNNNISEVSRKFYKSTFQDIFEEELIKLKKVNLSRIIPLIGAYIEENYFNKEASLESTIMVIPQSIRQMHFFKKRSTHKAETIQKYIKELHPTKFHYFQISAQLITIKSSLGNLYRVIEIKKMRMLKRAPSKTLLISEFVEEYNRCFSTSLQYVEPTSVGSSYFLDTGTMMEQSQINASTVSGGSDRQHSIKRKKAKQQNYEKSTTMKKDVFSIESLSRLTSDKIRLETIIQVKRHIQKFVYNMLSVIHSKRYAKSNNFYNNQIMKLEKEKSNNNNNNNNVNNSVDTNNDPAQKISYSDIISVESPSLYKNQKNGSQKQKSLKKKDNQMPLVIHKVPSSDKKKINFQGIQNNQVDSINNSSSAYEGEKEDVIGSVNYFGDLMSYRGGQFSASNEHSDLPYFSSLISPSRSDIPILPFQNISNFNLGSGHLGYEFSARYDYHKKENTNTMENEYDHNKNEGQESNYSTFYQNQDYADGLSSTKITSPFNSIKAINSKIQENNPKPSVFIQSPRDLYKDLGTGSVTVRDDKTSLVTPHLKSDNKLLISHSKSVIENKDQQKFYDKIGSSEFQKVQSMSLTETLSPVKIRKHGFKKLKQSTQLKQVQENQNENDNYLKSRSFLIDELEQENEEEEEENQEENKSKTKQTKRKNTDTLFDNELKSKRKALNDQASVKSALSQSYAKKQQVIESLTTRKRPLLIFTIQLMGIFSFFFMISVTSGIFIYLNTIFQSNVDNFNNLLVGPNLESDHSYLIKELEVTYMMNTNQLPSLNQQSLTNIQNIFNTLLSDFKSVSQLLFNERSSVGYSVYVNTNTLTVDYYLLLDKTQSLLYLSSSFPMAFLIDYSTLVLYTQMFYQIKPIKVPSTNRFIEKNLVPYIQEFQSIMQLSHDESLSQVTNMETNIIVTIAIMEGVALVVLLLAIPIYSKIQGSRENWLKLFGTFQQSKLQEMMNKIDIYLAEESQKYIEKQQNSKRKVVSTITNLKKYNGLLLIIIILCLILVSIYPIINIFYTQSFVNEFNYLIKEITLIISTRAQMNTEFALSFQVARKMLQGSTVDNSTIQYYLEIHQNNSQTIQDLYYLSEQFTGSRYQKQLYQDLLLATLNQDVCGPISKYPQYYPSNKTIDITLCKTTDHQIFTQGIIGTLKEIQTQFQNLQEIVFGPSKLYIKNFKQWVHDVDLNQLIEVQRQLSDYLQILETFLMSMTVDYKNYITNIQFWLYFYSLFILIAIFLIGFIFFVKKLTNSLYQARYLLTLINIEYILENSYIMSFLSDQISKSSNRN